LSYVSRTHPHRRLEGRGERGHSVKASMKHRGMKTAVSGRENEGTPPTPLHNCSGDLAGTDENRALVAPGLGAVKHNSYRPRDPASLAFDPK